MPVIRLRAALQDDLDLAYRITEDAMRPYVEQAFGGWNADEQWRKHEANFTPATHRIILVDAATAGFVAVEDFPDYTWLVKLYLFQAYRGQGIGSKVLNDLLAVARTHGKPVTLQVLRVNLRAQALYARHGFTVTGERPAHLFMTSGA